ncbi:hypothetical protein JCM10908_003143 [Rhodotorula pacifica]|uniref:uncharacterized protein n=1 Tax=Rhodotorula pacifica TaxID=1495444 RepID=UPI0031742C8F
MTPPTLPKTPKATIGVEPKRNGLIDQDKDEDDDDERRRQALAEELFPPSPPRESPTEAQSSGAGAGSAEEEEIIADSEVEREEDDDFPHAAPRKAGSPSSEFDLTEARLDSADTGGQRKHRRTSRRRTSSAVFDLDNSASDTEVVPDSQHLGEDARSPAEEDEGALARRLDQLQLGSAPFSAPSPSLLPASSPPAGSNGTMGKRPAAKAPRARRRITISLIDSSSSSSSDDDSLNKARTFTEKEQPRLDRDSAAVLPRASVDANDIRPLATDSPDSPSKERDSGNSSSRRNPVDRFAPNEDSRCNEDSPRCWPDDVIENDGVLIYNPTPKKRPVKLTPSRSRTQTPSRLPPSARKSTNTESPSRSRTVKDVSKQSTMGTIARGGSSLRVEVDLTCDTSDEEDAGQQDVEYRESSNELPSLRRVATPSPPADTPARPRAPRLPGPPPPRTPSRKSASARSAAKESATPERRLTAADRSRLPLELIRELDRAVFRQSWNGLRIVTAGYGGAEDGGKGLPDGIEVVWNARLRNTAGRASWKTSKKTVTADGESVTTTTHHAMVELSTKVTDTASKLRHTLAHELCHLAAWTIDGEMKPPHGQAFKRWAKRVMIVRPDIEVTTTHAYEIVYKYRWKCVSAVCGKIFGRHSSSIDPATHGCPCGARIVPIDKDGNPKPGYSIVTATGTIVSTPKTERKKSKWVEFLQSEGPLVRKEHPHLSQPEVFKLVAERWRLVKDQHFSSFGDRTARGLEDSLKALHI